MEINYINETINDILKDKSKSEIIENIKIIKQLCKSIIDIHINNKNLDKKQIEDLTQNLLNKIFIKGSSLKDLEMEYEKNFNLEQNYKKFYELMDMFKMFPQKLVNLTIDGKTYSILVFDTGNEYIPTKDILLPSKVMEALKQLKEQEKLDKLIDILENGVASIHIDVETKEKIQRELERRKLKKDLLDEDFGEYKNNDTPKTR